MDSEPYPLLDTGPTDARWRLILAHGAGAPMDSGFMEGVANRLAEHGIAVSRFEFPYMRTRRDSGKKKPPDRQPILLASWGEVLHATRAAHPKARIAIGGKSMGGRMATMLAADRGSASEIEAIVTLGYPFHPPGKPDRLRVDHFPSISIPTLMVQGTRDPFGRAEEVVEYTLPPKAELHWIDDGDHDLKPRKSTGRTQDDALEETAASIASFLAAMDSVSR